MDLPLEPSESRSSSEGNGSQGKHHTVLFSPKLLERKMSIRFIIFTKFDQIKHRLSKFVSLLFPVSGCGGCESTGGGTVNLLKKQVSTSCLSSDQMKLY